MSCVSSAVGGRDPGDSDGAAPSAFFFFESRPNSDSFGVGCGRGAGDSDRPYAARARRLPTVSFTRGCMPELW